MSSIPAVTDNSDLMNKTRMSAFSPAGSYAPPGGGNYAPPGGGNYAPPGGGNIDAAESPSDLSERSDT